MSRARRMKEKEKKDMPKFLKYILKFLILIVIVFSILFYLIKTNKIAFLSGFFDNIGFSESIKENTAKKTLDENSNLDTDTKSDSVKEPNSEFAIISEPVKVKNADKLVANNLDISKSSDNTYEITTTLENNSKKKLKNLKLSLQIYDSNKSKLASFDFTVDTILSKSKSTLYTISITDLSNASYYSLEFNK